MAGFLSECVAGALQSQSGMPSEKTTSHSLFAMATHLLCSELYSVSLCVCSLRICVFVMVDELVTHLLFELNFTVFPCVGVCRGVVCLLWPPIVNDTHTFCVLSSLSVAWSCVWN